MNWILENWTNVLTVLGGIYATATAIAVLTPSDKDDTVLDKIGTWADRIGLNIKGK